MTQIDRYLKSTDRAVDAVEIVHKKIPLVWQNHPDLEMLAVSSFVEGDSPCGIDRLIARWFIDAPLVQRRIDKLAEATDNVATRVSSFVERSKLGFSEISAAITDYWTVASEIPWFINRHVDCFDKVCFDSKSILSIQSTIEQIGDMPKRGASESQIKDFLSRISLVNSAYPCEQSRLIVEAARRWGNELLEELNRAVDEAAHRKENEVKRQKIALIIVCVLTVAFIVFGGLQFAERKEKERQETTQRELTQNRGVLYRAFIDGREVNAVLSSEGHEYELPHREMGISSGAYTRGGMIMAVVNNSVYSRTLESMIVDWEGVRDVDVRLEFIRRTESFNKKGSSCTEGQWIEGLRHPTEAHWISHKERGKWIPEKGYKETNPNSRELSTLVWVGTGND